uniref:Arsenate reductase n=1 Tax=Tetraselmis sp. GSL018 TaxID=582737 RepID=A0A061SD13_9CHLO|mmetsp:Transcript_6189/g.14885  ORF Transcript_6189/g.14885 Transcript_6189/m.14885 type:complete len:161 (-) Transcript_6189:61-543(-)
MAAQVTASVATLAAVVCGAVIFRPRLRRFFRKLKGSPRRILFVCGHNAGRSIAAEAIARKLRPDLTVASCGTVPSGKLNPVMKAALEERGYSVEGLASKGPDAVGGYEAWDLRVTMGCMDGQCPWVPGLKVVDWGLPDPAKDSSVVPEVISQVEKLVREL